MIHKDFPPLRDCEQYRNTHNVMEIQAKHLTITLKIDWTTFEFSDWKFRINFRNSIALLAEFQIPAIKDDILYTSDVSRLLASEHDYQIIICILIY